ncbi:MAG TPA: hypothetical protein VGH20_14665 [Myxococcales bacterium]|jgi:hypothetical protein
MRLAAAYLVFATAASAQTTQQAIVPAFYGIPQLTDPQASDPQNADPARRTAFDWTRIERAGSAVFAVVADGSFAALADDASCSTAATVPTDCHASGVTGLCQAKCQFRRNQNAGQKVFGYVITDSGKRDNDYLDKNGVLVQNCPSAANHKCVLNGGDLVLPANGGYKGMSSVQDWYNKFCPSQSDPSNCFIDGIFFDVGPSTGPVADSTQMADYQALFADFQNLRPFGSCSDSLHPARPCLLLNASQYLNSWAASVSDYFILWERALHGKDNQPPDPPNNTQDYVTAFSPSPVPAWWTANAAKAEHVVSVATQNDVASIVQASQDASHGHPSFLYVHDRFQYGSLACFFEQEIKAMTGQPAVPAKTWCDATSSCLDLTTTTCPSDFNVTIIVTDPSGKKIPVVIAL